MSRPVRHHRASPLQPSPLQLRPLQLRPLAGVLVLVGLIALVVLPLRPTEARFTDQEVAGVQVSASAMPAMGSLSCTGTGLLGLTGARISWTPPAGLPAGSELRMRVTINGQSLDVFLPATANQFTFDASLTGALGSLLTVTLVTTFTIEIAPVLRSGETVVWAGQSSSRTALALLNLVFNCS